MKKFLVMLLIATLCFSLAACGGDSSDSQAPADEPKDEKQLVIDAVGQVIQSEAFVSGQSLFTEFTGEQPSPLKVADVTRYEIPDFEAVKMDCYLVDIEGEVALWIDEAAQQGAVHEHAYLFIDATTGKYYDSISTDALGVQHDTATEEGRATYLMWVYAAVRQDGMEGHYLNNTETVTPWAEADVDAVNAGLGL